MVVNDKEDEQSFLDNFTKTLVPRCETGNAV